MKKLTIALFAAALLLMGQTVYAQDSTKQTTEAAVVDSSDADMSIEEMIGNEDMAELAEIAAEDICMQQELKNKFIEGDPR